MSWARSALEWTGIVASGLVVASLAIWLQETGRAALLATLVALGLAGFGAFLGSIAGDDGYGDPLPGYRPWLGALAGAVIGPWLLTLFWILEVPFEPGAGVIDTVIRLSWTLAITLLGAQGLKQPTPTAVHALLMAMCSCAMGWIWLQTPARTFVAVAFGISAGLLALYGKWVGAPGYAE